MNKKFDALIEVSLLPSDRGGREGPILSGYRGAHLIKDGYLTSGIIQLIEKEALFPGETTIAFVNYLTPEVYPNTLWVGKEMNIQEGGKIAGKATIKEVCNNRLLKGT